MSWEVRKDVWGVEKCGGVSGEVCWRVGKGCGGGVGKCDMLWGPNTLPFTLSHIFSLTSFPTLFSTFPPHPNTLSYTSSHTSSHIFPSSPPHLNTKTHFPTIPTSLLTFSKCGEVTVPCDKVIMWRSYSAIIWQNPLTPTF